MKRKIVYPHKQEYHIWYVYANSFEELIKKMPCWLEHLVSIERVWEKFVKHKNRPTFECYDEMDDCHKEIKED